MAAADTFMLMGQLAAVAFLPIVVYLVWIRNVERHNREPWRSLLLAFWWGAVGGVLIALVFQLSLSTRPDAIEAAGLSMAFYGAVILAPFTEEFTKALGLRWVRDAHPEPEDGLIYGAAAGLGFAATENLLYGIAALSEGGLESYVATSIIRSITGAFLHASASALVGWAIWKKRAGQGTAQTVVLFYLMAVGAHALFNFVAIQELVVGLLVIIAGSIIFFGWVRSRIRRLDARLAAEAPPAMAPPTQL